MGGFGPLAKIIELMKDLEMTPEEIATIQTLRDQGYAVVLFNPEELVGAPARKVEDRMCERGWETIDYLTDDDL